MYIKGYSVPGYAGAVPEPGDELSDAQSLPGTCIVSSSNQPGQVARGAIGESSWEPAHAPATEQGDACCQEHGLRPSCAGYGAECGGSELE